MQREAGTTLKPVVTYSRPTMAGYYIVVDEILYRIPNGQNRRSDDPNVILPDEVFALTTGTIVDTDLLKAIEPFREY